MLKFEEYLADFTNTVDLIDFIINMLIATILSLIIKAFYTKFGKSFSNREKFSSIFVPMALATLLIITVVQASIALSLGLVGALSIVRFRAAIKEPEELTYIFIIIGVGLTCGANKPLLAIVAILIILPLMYINSRSGQKLDYSQNKMLLNISSSQINLEKITELLSKTLTQVELKRFDTNSDRVNVIYLVKANSVSDLSMITNEIISLDSSAQINIMDQPEMIL